MQCAECRFMARAQNESAGYGRCRRNPPTASPSGGTAVFPIVRLSLDWCGEFDEGSGPQERPTIDHLIQRTLYRHPAGLELAELLEAMGHSSEQRLKKRSVMVRLSNLRRLGKIDRDHSRWILPRAPMGSVAP